MSYVDDSIKAHSQITQITVLNDETIAFSTKFHGVKFFIDKFDIQISIINKELNNNVTAISFSNDGKFIAFSIESSINIFDIQTRKIIKTIKVSNLQIDSLSFDLSSNYIIVGTANGRVFQYKYDDSTLIRYRLSFNKILLGKH